MNQRKNGQVDDRVFGIYRYLHSLRLEDGCHGILKAFVAGLVSSTGWCTLYHPSTKKFLRRISQQRSDAEILHLKKCLTETYLNTLHGVPTSREVKGIIMPRFLSQCKKQAILLQYCKLVKALPMLSKRAEEAALQEQLERLTTPFSREVPSSIKRIIDSLPTVKVGPNLPGDFVSNSGCLEAERKHGGRLSLLKRVQTPRSLIQRIGPLDLRAQSALSRVPSGVEQLKETYPSEVSTDCSPVPIREYGAKIRIVTKHSSMTVASSYRGRRALWPLLTNDEHIVVSESLKDPELAELSFSASKGKRFVYSADLSAATDFLGWPVVHYICDHFSIPYEWAHPHYVGGAAICRGTGMGLPCSWPILSLAHYAVCRVVDPKHDFRIKGDDLIALWSMDQITHYASLLEKIGLRLNTKKSVISPNLGVFCEVQYRRIGPKLLRTGVYSLRSFVKDQPLAYDQWSMLIRHGVSQRKMNRMFRFFHSRLMSRAKAVKVPLYLPRKMGGLGFPPCSMNRSLSKPESAAVRKFHNGAVVNRDECEKVGRLSSAYLNAFSSVRLVCDGSKQILDHLEQNYASVSARAALLDALNGRLEVPKIRNISVYSLRRTFRANCGGTPYPCTVDKAYNVLSRLGMTLDPNNLKLFGGLYSLQAFPNESSWEPFHRKVGLQSSF